MLVKKDNKYLLIERKIYPFGFAPPAGHVDNSPSFEEAARRELKEEVGLMATMLQLLIEGRKNLRCSRPGGDHHDWKVYSVEVTGDITINPPEVKKYGWYSIEEIKKMAQLTDKYLKGEIDEKTWETNPGLEQVWYEWFKQLEII